MNIQANITDLSANILTRRRLRKMLDKLKEKTKGRGFTMTYDEKKGWFSSQFVVYINGTLNFGAPLEA